MATLSLSVEALVSAFCHAKNTVERHLLCNMLRI